MRRVTLAITLAAIAFGFASQSVSAIDVGCNVPRPDGAVIYSSAASGEALGWAPDCVRVPASFATPASVAFTNLDPLFHQPVAAGCFDAFTVNAGQTKSVDAIRLIGGHVYVGLTPCDEDATQARVGTFIPKTEGPKFDVIEHGVDGPGTVTIHFICAFHGPAMHGRIVLTPA